MSKRNSDKTSKGSHPTSSSTPSVEVVEAKCTKQNTAAEERPNSLTDEELERLAAEEILRETESARLRADSVGSLGWQKRKVKLNQRFVSNTVLQTLKSNKSKYS